MKKSPLPMETTVRSEKQLYGEDGLVNLLRQHFGHSEFRGKQLEAIEAVLSGRDCFCLMPTGGGKSMCYQIPALAKSGIVLVISPLIALMENQVATLKEKGITAEYLSSTQIPHVKEKIYRELDSGKPSLRLLYVTPELVATAGFMSKITKLYTRGLLNLIAVDEAHCVSTWGHDFRVQKDVIESLCLQDPLVLKTSFNRPNIFYEVRYKDLLDDAYSDLSNLLKSSGGVCSIIYCLERTKCDDLSAHLSKAGISCAAYHAGLNNKVRSSVLNDWISSKIQVVIATVAFGMGIDRKDVRVVCHFDIPKSMEAFYQESGRAGRDQLPSRSLLYYGLDDRKRMEFIVSNVKSKKSQSVGSQNSLLKKSLADLNQMAEYCEGFDCRRKKLLGSFGEQVSSSFCGKTCDVCKHPNLVAKHLEELALASSNYRKNGLPPIFINSLPNMDAEKTEFWNREDEASISDEDISDSDDGVEVVNSLTRSKLSSKSGLNERLEHLERAEEAYLKKNGPSKQAGSDKKAISETLREAAKQRLSNALKQAQQRLGNSIIEFKESASVLENECYKKYGKVGKTFYNSQVASTVRWLSSASISEINDQLHSGSTKTICAANLNSMPSLPEISDQDPQPTELNNDKNQDRALPEASSRSVQIEIPSQEIALPPILSFSEFVSKKGEEGQPSLSSARGKHLMKRSNAEPGKPARNDAEKRGRLQ